MKIETQTNIKVTVGDAVLNLTREEAKRLLDLLKSALGETSVPLFPAVPVPQIPEKIKHPWDNPWEPPSPWTKPWLDTHNWPPGTILCCQ